MRRVISSDDSMIVVQSESSSLADFLSHSKEESILVAPPSMDIRSVSQPPLDMSREYQQVIPALFPASINSDLISKDLNIFLLLLEKNDNPRQTIQLQLDSKVQKLPGFGFSKYNFMQSVPSIILSASSFSSVFDISMVPDYPKDRLVVKLNSDLTDREYAYITDSTRSMY